MGKEFQNRKNILGLTPSLVKNTDCSNSKKVKKKRFDLPATSVGKDYREAGEAKSNQEFYSRFRIVTEEIYARDFWPEIISEKHWQSVETHLREANELTGIFVTTLKIMHQKQRTSNF